MAIDLSPTTQDALSIIVQKYNQGLDPALQLNDTDYLFDAATANPDVEYNKSTRLRARPTAVSGKVGAVFVYYNRIDLSAVDQKPIVTKGTATKVADVVPLLNSYFGINLVAADYINSDLPTVNGDTTVVITVGSLLFQGTLEFTLELGGTLGIRAPAV